jgi:catechol 2,3-dioxygenase-like lactoylglutathione lyase family enzyme
MRIVVTSVFVKDQDKSLEFYTKKLGFVTKDDIPLGSLQRRPHLVS